MCWPATDSKDNCAAAHVSVLEIPILTPRLEERSSSSSLFGVKHGGFAEPRARSSRKI